MAQRRKRQRKWRKRRTGCAAALIIFVMLSAGAAYGIPWAVDRFGGQVRETFSETVEKAVNTLSTEQADIPELTIPAEEAEPAAPRAETKKVPDVKREEGNQEDD